MKSNLVRRIVLVGTLLGGASSVFAQRYVYPPVGGGHNHGNHQPGGNWGNGHNHGGHQHGGGGWNGGYHGGWNGGYNGGYHGGYNGGYGRPGYGNGPWNGGWNQGPGCDQWGRPLPRPPFYR